METCVSIKVSKFTFNETSTRNLAAVRAVYAALERALNLCSQGGKYEQEKEECESENRLTTLDLK